MRRLHRPTREGAITIGRQLVLSTVGGAVGIVSNYPPAGLAIGGLAALVGVRWTSPKEKAQATRIAELEARFASSESWAGVEEREKKAATRRKSGNLYP
ncbi:MAG: hypothetical protein QOI09_2503 [Chloroflexota bacterium]|nr:hypothetical protein [Chloroflexota bacterium]